MNSDTLERLIEALEARAWDGSWRGVLDAETKMPPQAFSDAYHDDMNAALFLLAALLPDHTWGRTPTGNMWVHRLGRPFV